MLFNSLDFAIFLPLFFIIYWFIVNNNYRIQNLFIVIASYIFYGWWDYRFLSLILLSTFIDFIIGKRLSRETQQNKRRFLLLISLITNIGILFIFKYFNFFIESFSNAFTVFNLPFKINRINILLPVGISFYTFQTLSYTIDIFNKKLKPTNDFIAFAAFVSFFPQLVAGPIERASNLLPQFFRKRSFNYIDAVEGMRQILWGFFKKIVIADNSAVFVNQIFSNYSQYSFSTLVIGVFLFSIQIYADFSGYSDIAIGISKLFGFKLQKNFAFPYFSRDIAEFWRRWHISLTTWFRDYIYIPLGGSRVNTALQIRNTLIVFLVSGLWHGANWTYIFWGTLNAIYFLPLLLTKKNRIHTNNVASGKLIPSFKEIISMLMTFCLTMLAWIFFRSESLSQAFGYIKKLYKNPQINFSELAQLDRLYLTFLFIFLFLIVEWLGREKEFAISQSKAVLKRQYSMLLYIVIVSIIALFGNFEGNQFIYFQF